MNHSLIKSSSRDPRKWYSMAAIEVWLVKMKIVKTSRLNDGCSNSIKPRKDDRTQPFPHHESGHKTKICHYRDKLQEALPPHL